MLHHIDTSRGSVEHQMLPWPDKNVKHSEMCRQPVSQAVSLQISKSLSQQTSQSISESAQAAQFASRPPSNPVHQSISQSHCQSVNQPITIINPFMMQSSCYQLVPQSFGQPVSQLSPSDEASNPRVQESKKGVANKLMNVWSLVCQSRA